MDSQRVHVQNFHQFGVNAFTEVAIFIQDVSKAAGHTCAEVHAGFPQDTDDAAGHVFTAVVADAFHHGDGAGVTYRKAFARASCRVQTTAGRAIQTGVANDACFMATEGGADRRTNRQQTARHAFTDVVVGVAGQVQLNAAGVPDAEALARGTAKVGGDRVGGQPLVAVSLGDITGQRRPNGTVGVANIEPERFALFVIHIRLRLLQQLRVEHAVIERRVALGAVQRLAWQRLSGFQQFTELQFLLFRRKAFQFFQQVGAADQVHQTLHAQLRHQLAGFAGDEFKVVGHFEW